MTSSVSCFLRPRETLFWLPRAPGRPASSLLAEPAGPWRFRAGPGAQRPGSLPVLPGGSLFYRIRPPGDRSCQEARQELESLAAMGDGEPGAHTQTRAGLGRAGSRWGQQTLHLSLDGEPGPLQDSRYQACAARPCQLCHGHARSRHVAERPPQRLRTCDSAPGRAGPGRAGLHADGQTQMGLRAGHPGPDLPSERPQAPRLLLPEGQASLPVGPPPPPPPVDPKVPARLSGGRSGEWAGVGTRGPFLLGARLGEVPLTLAGRAALRTNCGGGQGFRGNGGGPGLEQRASWGLGTPEEGLAPAPRARAGSWALGRLLPASGHASGIQLLWGWQGSFEGAN